MNKVLAAATALILVVGLGCIPFPSGITVIGDSITDEGPTITALQAALPSRPVYNAGCGATTTWTWLQEAADPHVGMACGEALLYGGAFEPLVRPVLPDTHVVFIHLGVNDARFRAACLFNYEPCDPEPIEPTEYNSNLRALIQKIDDEQGPLHMGITAYPIVVLVKPALIDCQAQTCNLSAHFANSRIVAYGEEIDSICVEMPVLCGPDLKDVMLPEHYDAGDGVHPNQAGYEAIAQAYLDFLISEGL